MASTTPKERDGQTEKEESRTRVRDGARRNCEVLTQQTARFTVSSFLAVYVCVCVCIYAIIKINLLVSLTRLPSL